MFLFCLHIWRLNALALGPGGSWLFPGIVGRFNGSGILTTCLCLATTTRWLNRMWSARFFLMCWVESFFFFFFSCSEDNGSMFFLKHFFATLTVFIVVTDWRWRREWDSGHKHWSRCPIFVLSKKNGVLLCCKVTWCKSEFSPKNEELDLRWQSEVENPIFGSGARCVDVCFVFLNEWCNDASSSKDVRS